MAEGSGAGAPSSARRPFHIAAIALSIIGALLVGVLAIGLILPGEWRAETEAWIEAEPTEVYDHVTSADGWGRWTPMPESGIEALAPAQGHQGGWSWDDPAYGQGVFTILESDPPHRLDYRVEVEGGSLVTDGRMTLHAESGGTRIQWREEGDFGWNPLLGYVAAQMPDTQGEQMEQSLERLSSLVTEGRVPEGSEGETER